MKISVTMILILSASAASASVIVQDLGGLGNPACTCGEEYGQRFTTPSGGPWVDLTFSFYSDVPATTPVAAGTAFLLNQEYLGAPGALSSSIPDFVASVDVSNGHYVFPAEVEIWPDTTYWIYENGPLEVSGGDATAGAEAYITLGSPFDPIIGENSNFTLSGAPVAPEPASILAIFSGICVLGAHRIRRRKSDA